ncbi:hypothetical protein SFK227_2987 [Shigella flexneri K-227]|uniref:Uncharacterized protein n=1 Tax=Shigella flexneri K-227 TaxID=766147 RepID=F5NYC5_SHIFL|nr:hypothetical protein SFK272_3147 [Shigella flexneri K-272]EGK35313.1 hypothetical protein SFK227_2987 [Shigella flexneri K-227]
MSLLTLTFAIFIAFMKVRDYIFIKVNVNNSPNLLNQDD